MDPCSEKILSQMTLAEKCSMLSGARRMKATLSACWPVCQQRAFHLEPDWAPPGTAT